jgi:diguanylate cyclase (GGDEF)-like protein
VGASPSRDLTPLDLADTDAPVVLGPLVAPRRLVRIAPYLGVGMVGLGIVRFDPDADVRLAMVALAVGGAAILAALVVPWIRLPRWVQGLVPLLCLASVAVGLSADDGLGAPQLPILIVPVIWLTVYERGTAFWVGLGGALLFLMFAMALATDHDDVLRGTAALGVGVLIIPSMRKVVDDQRTYLRLASSFADRDPLTGVLNRRALGQRAQGVRERRGRGVGLVFLDIDDFKSINDRLGHQAGDELLTAVARRLLHNAREDDIVARVGGDEFVLVCGGDRVLIEAMAARLDAALGSSPYRLSAATIDASASIGIAHTSEPMVDLPELLRRADEEMYGNKRRKKLDRATSPEARSC